MINIIVATSENNVIGRENGIPWYIPQDLKHFKKLTVGTTVIMGRKTYESLPKEYKPLPNRVNIIISRNKKYIAKGCLVVSSLEQAIKKSDNNKQIFIIGGGEIYKKAIKYTEKIYLTKIHKEIKGDTYFPKLNKFWKLVSEEKKEGFSFLIYTNSN
jgi:dihydrofolate reductase